MYVTKGNSITIISAFPAKVSILPRVWYPDWAHTSDDIEMQKHTPAILINVVIYSEETPSVLEEMYSIICDIR